MAKPDYSKLFAELDNQYGFKPGTMASLKMQESGNDPRFDADPAAFHYSGDKPKSSARGLFGVVKGTAADPGYGVKPLTDWSPEGQGHFAAQYLQALTKKTGSLEGGLARYGEGDRYARQVAARIPNVSPVQAAPVQAPVQLAQAPTPTTVAYRDVAPNNGPIPMGYVAPDPEGWDQIKQAMPEQIQASSLDFGNRVQQPGYVSMEMPKVDFRAFSRFKGRA